ncbi:MAG: glycerophosphodiester phosphodiesterase [Gammaproteobacteria bacterium]|nr:glycerophosphodiester phosphodiesterase [Gammaproteobacteria bacterium]
MKQSIRNQFAAILRGLLILVLAAPNGIASGFDLQGHRGARGLMPENTLPAFAAALSIGVSTLEMDLAVTRDRKVVVMHNPRFEPEIARDSEGNWLQQSSDSVHSMSLDTVKSYDVGRLNPERKYARHYPGQQAIDGTRVPTLAQVFELVNASGNRLVRFNIEIKINPHYPQLTFPPQEFAGAVVEVIRRHEMESRVTIQSFDWRALQAVQDMAPEIVTSYLTVNQDWLSNLQTGMAGKSPWLNGLDVDDFDGSAARAIKAAGGRIWSSYHREVSARSIKLAQDLGLLVHVWTVNEATRMRELIEMGVDGIITDYPDRLRRVLEGLGMPTPTPTSIRY